MVTLERLGKDFNYQKLKIVGLSTDDKPVTDIDGVPITNGSIFKEIDTGAEYLYDLESSSWIKNESAAGSGKDGITPRLQKTESAIQVSYDNGESYEDLVELSELKGEPGAKGDSGTNGSNGAPGKDGTSPTVSTEPTEGGTKVTITDAQGEHDFTVLNGKDGAKGDKGEPGANGTDGAAGKDGSPGENGKDGATITSITLTKGEDGSIISGSAHLSNDSEIEISIVEA